MNISVVLVKSKYPRNVGMVARALANFNLERLILINPQCEINFEAREGAAQGQKPLRRASIYADWDSFLANEPEGPRVAFSRRVGKKRQAFPLSELKEWACLQESRPIYLIFGAEDHGLSTEDLDIAHRSCYFELPGEMPSMNLSHAVVHALTTLASGAESGCEHKNEDASSDAMEVLDESLKIWLESLNFQLTPGHWNALVALKQFMMKAAPRKKEVVLLNNVIQQTLRRLREK